MNRCANFPSTKKLQASCWHGAVSYSLGSSLPFACWLRRMMALDTCFLLAQPPSAGMLVSLQQRGARATCGGGTQVLTLPASPPGLGGTSREPGFPGPSHHALWSLQPCTPRGQPGHSASGHGSGFLLQQKVKVHVLMLTAIVTKPDSCSLLQGEKQPAWGEGRRSQKQSRLQSLYREQEKGEPYRSHPCTSPDTHRPLLTSSPIPQFPPTCSPLSTAPVPALSALQN